MNNDRIPYRPIVAVMLMMILGLIGILWSDINADLQEVKDSTTKIEKEYYRIGALEAQIKDVRKQIERLDQRFDDLFIAVEQE